MVFSITNQRLKWNTTKNERKPCYRYCGELSSAYPSGGQQICSRCDREHADTFLHSDELYVQDRLRRNEKA
jgi:hypothetical protein